MEQTKDRSPGDAAGDDQQNDRIAERRQDRGSAQPVGVTLVRRRLAPDAKPARPPRARARRRVVAGVGDQRHRVGDHAVNAFADDVAAIEQDADGKRGSEASWRVDMPMTVAMAVIVIMAAASCSS